MHGSTQRRVGPAEAPVELDLTQMEAVRGGCASCAGGAEMQQAQQPQQQAAAPEEKKPKIGEQILSTVLPMFGSLLGGGK